MHNDILPVHPLGLYVDNVPRMIEIVARRGIKRVVIKLCIETRFPSETFSLPGRRFSIID